MTDEDFDHALGLYQTVMIRRGEELKNWKRLAFDLIRAAGGTLRISMFTALDASAKDVLYVERDPNSGDMVYRVRRDP